MKGIVFTEFLEMVEEKFGYEMVDDIIVQSKVPSNGVYTAVGTYDHSEMVSLVVALNKASGVSVPDLLKTYGRHLFHRFVHLYPKFFEGDLDALTFLEGIDHYIHAEVLKLYPDAQLPKFITKRVGDHQIIMEYQSERQMADFAHGLIEGCLTHFEESASIDVKVSEETASTVFFTITKNE